MFFQITGAFAEFERAMIRSRVRAARERAKSRGARLGRPKTGAKVEAVTRARLAAGEGVKKVARRSASATVPCRPSRRQWQLGPHRAIRLPGRRGPRTCARCCDTIADCPCPCPRCTRGRCHPPRDTGCAARTARQEAVAGRAAPRPRRARPPKVPTVLAQSDRRWRLRSHRTASTAIISCAITGARFADTRVFRVRMASSRHGRATRCSMAPNATVSPIFHVTGCARTGVTPAARQTACACLPAASPAARHETFIFPTVQ
jgi:hypothetical protein